MTAFAESAGPPLFAEVAGEPLKGTLTLPLTELLRSKGKRPTVAATLALEGHEGALAVDVTPRGKSRLDRCRFPPLWLDFPKKALGGTLFAGQNKLKLVTHCSTKLEPRGYLAAEMVAYRLLNMLTNKSFRVRAIELTYVDSNKPEREPERHHAFFIEHKNQLAERLALAAPDVTSLNSGQLEPAYTGMLGLYQYMIGNTDFRGPENDDCCHNAVPMHDAANRYFVIPYDFDSSGIVDPSYGEPNEALGVRRFTQRLYRGFCRHNDQLLTAAETLRAQRSAVNALIADFDDVPHLKRDKLQSFMDRFYKTLENPRSVNSRLIKRCRG